MIKCSCQCKDNSYVVLHAGIKGLAQSSLMNEVGLAADGYASSASNRSCGGSALFPEVARTALLPCGKCCLDSPSIALRMIEGAFGSLHGGSCCTVCPGLTLSTDSHYLHPHPRTCRRCQRHHEPTHPAIEAYIKDGVQVAVVSQTKVHVCRGDHTSLTCGASVLLSCETFSNSIFLTSSWCCRDFNSFSSAVVLAS